MWLLRSSAGLARWIAIGAVSLLLIPDLADAQKIKPSIVGRIVSSLNETPVVGAKVTLIAQRKSTTTDSAGRFAFRDLKPGAYHIEALLIGYAPLAALVDLGEEERKEIEFRTDSVGVLLPTIFVDGESQPSLIKELTKFERRMAVGTGRFITREQILQRNPMVLTDMLRFLPGVRSHCRGMTCQLLLNHDPRGCGPAIFVDGISTVMQVLESTHPNSVQGIEVYSGPSEVPPEINNEAARCGGAIAIWTRRGLSP